MSMTSRRTAATALAAVAALTLAACGSDSGDEGSGGNGEFVVGTLLPETGSLAFLGPPEIAAANLAVKEINAEGGVLGKPVRLVTGDSGDTTSNIAGQTVDRLLSEQSDVIIGAASSSVSLSVIDKIVGAGVVQFSPANTSDKFTTYDDKGLYFRTAPPDVQQGTVLAQYIADKGVTKLAVLALQDAYGEGLADQIDKTFTANGGQIVKKIIYDPKAASYDDVVQQAKDAGPDGVALIGFDESQKVLTSMVAKGIGPNTIPVFGSDGNMGNALGEKFTEQGILKGMSGTTPLTELSPDFQAKVKAIDPSLVDFNYAGETYDAIVISALAAEKAKSDKGTDFAKEINGITKDGDKCTSYSACLKIIKDGGNPDYDGITGPLEFTDPGEPGKASFGILAFGDDNKTTVEAYRFPK